MRYYRIGEVSKITGISKDTLHFYNKAGLLIPEYIDPHNGYGYYSHRNLWQLDIISTCRKLNIPLETVKQILSLKDNEEIIKLLMQYREEAIRLSDYYKQVANDIIWYKEENEHIREAENSGSAIHEEYLESETVIIGDDQKNGLSYHANLQSASNNEIKYSDSIRRKYGYLLDKESLLKGKVIKKRGYLKLENISSKENLYEIPAGRYVICTLQINNETVDFSPVYKWIMERNYEIGSIYAEEIGLQLFPYMDHYYCSFKIEIIEP